jgi:hypothetical protein
MCDRSHLKSDRPRGKWPVSPKDIPEDLIHEIAWVCDLSPNEVVERLCCTPGNTTPDWWLDHPNLGGGIKNEPGRI